MDVLYPACAGLDVHQRTVVACVLVGPGARPTRLVETCATMTADLLRLSDWLTAHGVTHVAMESTGVYWKPIWTVLEGAFELLLVNAQHVKAVPGRKTDVKDCEWLADLLRHGLLRASFVPPAPQRALRELTRTRTQHVQMRVAECNRLLKVLESANIKLAAVVSDIRGVSARQMLEALVAGETDPGQLAELAKGKLRQKLPELEQALAGRVAPHHRFLVAFHLATMDALDAGIDQLSAEIERQLEPAGAAPALLQTIPGVGVRVAQVILAEIGTDLSRFPSPRHLASWAALCPGNRERAGKRRSGATRHGNAALRSALCEAANAAVRRPGSRLAAVYRRIAARRGSGRAIVAVAHKLLVIVYHVLVDGTPYREPAVAPLDPVARRGVERRLTTRLERLGNRVTVQALHAPG
jgi:transposase